MSATSDHFAGAVESSETPQRAEIAKLREALKRLIAAADGQKPIGDMSQFKAIVAERDAAIAQAKEALK